MLVGAERIDSSWPPVLVAAVLVAVSAAILSFVVVYRKLRADARGQRKGHAA